MIKKVLILNETQMNKSIRNNYSYILLNKKSLYKNIILILLIIASILFYIFSLCSIEPLNMKCYKKEGVECFYILAKLTFISSIFLSIAIYLMLLKNFKKFYFIFVIIIFSFLFYIDHDNRIINHGFFNILLLIISTLILIIILFFIHYLYYLLKRKKYFYFLLILIILSFIFTNLKIYKLNHFNCNNWPNGLNDTLIDNISKDYPCHIKIPQPHSCYLKEIGSYFDLTTKYRLTCLEPKRLKNEKENFLKDIGNIKFYEISKKNHFGFPLTNTDNINPYEFGTFAYRGKKRIIDYIYENIIFMDLYNENKSKYYPNISQPEIEIKLKDNFGKLIVNVHKNITLVNEREQIINRKQNKLMYKNVIVMFFDTVSRAHFFRKFHKTSNFFENFSKYELKKEKKNMTIFQYFKYHTLNTYTDPNLIAAYYGGKLFGNGTHFAKYFKENGFIIGRLNGYCSKESVINLKNLKAFVHTRFDHEGISLECIRAFFKGILASMGSSLVQKCLFGKSINQYSLEYLESFWINYIEQYKMFIINIIDGHEATGELIGHFDETLYNFFKNFDLKGYLKDTTIILFSDHGMNINGPLYLFDSLDFLYERTLGLLILIIPNDEKLYKDNLYEKMKSNQQTFVTPFDIYNTLIHLSNGEINKNYIKNSVNYGSSLFTKINYKYRFCQSNIYESQINLKYCSCQMK